MDSIARAGYRLSPFGAMLTDPASPAALSRRQALGLGAAGAAVLSTGCLGLASGAEGADSPDTTELVRQLASGETTPVRALEDSLTRADRVNPRINAIIHPLVEQARAQAQTVALGPDRPLAGVPTLVKDLSDVAGAPTTYGSRAFKGFVATKSSPVIAAQIDGGMIVFGKSTTPESGLLPTTEPLIGEPTHNPWNPEHIAGGSSGGAAAAVAARIVPIATASDGGGSIRIPAACCGLVGLKPTRGRLPGEGKVTDFTLSSQGWVTRSVRDTALALATFETEAGGLSRVGHIKGPSTRRLKIGLIIEPHAGTALDPEVRAGCERLATLLEEMGHSVRDLGAPIDGSQFAADFTALWAMGAAEFAKDAAAFSGQRIGPDILEPFTLGLLSLAANLTEESGKAAVGRLQGLAAQYDGLFPGVDVVLSPTLATPPPKIGHLAPTVDFETLQARLTEFVAYTPLQNVAGAPSISLPLARTAKGLPLGMMFSAAKGDEATLLALAYELELAAPWSSFRPAIRA